MGDIFDNTVICRKCDREMKPSVVSKNGFNLRILKCDKCGELIVHPEDKLEYQNFMKLKEKEFNVKMRMVGNSYAVSIPKEIVDFMKEQEDQLDNMVRLSLDQLGKISLMFNSCDSEERPRVISAKEVKVVRNGKPVYHSRKVVDSANPDRNQTKVFKSNEMEED